MQHPLKIVIVEDEVNNVLLIQEMLKKIPFPTEVVGIAAEIDEAVRLINKVQPQLVLLDIMIKGGTSFTVLEKLEGYTFEIIFVTAYNQFAIDAIKKQALDYILKPVNYSEFSAALVNCKNRIEQKSKINTILQNDTNQFFMVKTNSGSEVIPFDTIVYFEADGSYTNCTTTSNTIVVSKNIGDIEKELPAQSFFRCHHSFIINIKHIQKVELNRSGTILCTNGQILYISQRKKKEFIDFINKNN